MPASAVQGILASFQLGTESIIPLVALLREVFINETPLFSRLPHVHVGAPEYKQVIYDVRPRTFTIAAAVTAPAALSTSTITLADVSYLQVGDFLEINNTGATAFERVEVLADPNTTNNTVSVMRGVEGTTPVANDTTNAPSTLGYIIGNSRLGNEINQTAYRSIRSQIDQYVQTMIYPVQVGGLVNALDNITLPGSVDGVAVNDVFGFEQKVKMREMVRDIEYSSYYALGQSAGVVGSTGKRKMKGLRAQIGAYKSGANVRLAAGGAYTKLSFIADTVQKCLDAGGDPDVIMMSTNFTTGLAVWSIAQQQFTSPRTTPQLGIAVREFDTAFAGQPMTIIPSFQLRPGSIFVGTSSDLKFRYIRDAFFQRRGVRGDAWEGDLIGDYTVEAGHPGWHAWVEGISTFAA